MLTVNPKLRIYGETHRLFRLMQGSVAKTGDAFHDPRFAENVLAEMAVMRGRELPGFQNSQVFYGFMVRICMLSLLVAPRAPRN